MMNKVYIRLLLLACLLMAGTAAMAQKKLPKGGVMDKDITDPDKLNAQEPETIEEIDTLTFRHILEDLARRDTIMPEDAPEPYSIGMLTRAYADRIVLRWAPSEYVPWHVLNSAGYVVNRIGLTKDGVTSDTLAIVKPWPLEKFKQEFAQEDSLAGVAVQLIYGGAETRFGQTAAIPGSSQALMEVYDEQQSVVGMAMMVAELRPDLAEAMGLMYVDRTAQKNIEYSYIITANVPDSVMMIHGDATPGIMLGQWKPQPFRYELTDSLSPPTTTLIYWPKAGMYSTYDIERQDTEGGAWHKLNERPYVTLTAIGDDQPLDNGMHMYKDNVPKVGIYRYRVSGYDSFGDKSEPSEPLVVEVPDMVPPQAPMLKNIVVDHPDEQHAYATIYFHVDTVEADVKGYLPLYRHDRVKKGEWHALTMDFTAPGDSVMKVDVSGLPTGQLSIAAYDEAGNQGASIPQMILLDDYLPPSAPTGLNANVFPDGYLELRWNESPELDVAFYEVFAANDSLGLYMNRSSDDQIDTVFVDSLALGLNQAYIYYKVRAVDFSGNASADSEILKVVRPNFIPPSVCRIDTMWVTDDAIHMHWLQSNEADLDYHRLFRKLDGDDVWTLMGVYKADSLRLEGDRIRFIDSPKPNMKKRYIYAVETCNLSGVTSGLSRTQTFLFTGPRIVEVPLKVFADYKKEGNETRLVWETGTVPDYGPWYYCIYRKGAGDKDFKFLLAAKPEETQFTDNLLRPGQEAEYYMMVQYDDGRRSQRSNVVKVSAPLER